MIPNHTMSIQVAMTTGVTIVTTLVALAIWRKMRGFQQVGHISKLIIYPIKSCRGVSVQMAQCTPLGLKYGLLRDRTFMIVDIEKKTFVSLAQNPSLVLIEPSLRDGGNEIWLDAPGMETLKISVDKMENAVQKSEHLISVNYKNLEMTGNDCGDTYAQWLQRYLNVPNLRLIYLATTAPPVVCNKKDKIGDMFKKNDVMSFNFTSSYLLLSESSHDDFVGRLAEPIPITNFRPNVTVEGAIPYDEDKWVSVRLGDEAVIQTRKLCQRCPYINVNADNGVPNKTILNTLYSYRKCWDENLNKRIGSTSPLIGLNMALERAGVVKVGDLIFATYA